MDAPDLEQARACLRASALAYSNPANSASGIWAEGTGLRIQTSLAHVLVTDITGADGLRTKLIAFRGTAAPLDLLTDVRIWRKPIDGYTVHAGFLQAWESVQYRILEGVAAVRYVVTGHSLGGALACLCALAIESRAPGAVLAVHTFGQPRIGGAGFALSYRTALGSRTWRWVNEEDVVARLPGVLSGYVHAGREVFIPALGPWRVDPPLWFKIVSDAIGAWREWRDGRLALTADHHIAAYLAKLSALTCAL